MIYETPSAVADYLAAHAPQKCASLLDPAVGRGSLLQPFIEKAEVKRILAIDRRSSCAKHLQALRNQKLQFLQADFLRRRIADRFDCIAMNPPFAARPSDQVKISVDKQSRSIRIPVEAAFVFRAVRLLNPGGRLLAILPASFISSSKLRWAREHLATLGSIIEVHELPSTTVFSNVEVAVYVLVFERSSRRTQSITLSNSNLLQPLHLHLRRCELKPDWRLDYGFHDARRWMQKIVRKTPHLGWTRLDQLASISRGAVESPIVKHSAIHSTDYTDIFWTPSAKTRKEIRNNCGVTQRCDLLLRRVGRGNTATLGPASSWGHLCSDCLYRVRPGVVTSRLALLFAFRVLLSCKRGEALLEQGTGAKYISRDRLDAIKIPIKLASAYPALFAQYKTAWRSKLANVMKGIEQSTRVQFDRCLRRLA
jgi:hypothetical protein